MGGGGGRGGGHSISSVASVRTCEAKCFHYSEIIRIKEGSKSVHLRLTFQTQNHFIGATRQKLQNPKNEYRFWFST